MAGSKAEQTTIPGTDRETDTQLENAIRNIKSKTEAVTEARNEKKKAEDRGQELLKEKALPFYVSEKQRFKLVATSKEGVKLEHWEPPAPGKAEKAEA
jgi:hypothetical protein